MELIDVMYEGPPIEQHDILQHVPSEYRALLEQINGFVQFYGGLHIRGICTEPLWHSLQEVWTGEHALSQHYPVITSEDIPFGQDVVGDQFLLRNELVYQLHTETGDITPLHCTFMEFLRHAQQNPVEYLSLQPMLQYYQEGGELQPGQLLNVYPPFCTKEAADGVSLQAVDAFERLDFLATFAQQIRLYEDDQRIRIVAKRSQ